MTYTEEQIRHHRELTLDLMLKLGPEHFDMRSWYSSDCRVDLGLRAVVDLTACGTTGCMGGTSAVALAAIGLTLGDAYEVSDALGLGDVDRVEHPFFRWMNEPREVQHAKACAFLAELLGAEQ